MWQLIWYLLFSYIRQVLYQQNLAPLEWKTYKDNLWRDLLKRFSFKMKFRFEKRFVHVYTPTSQLAGDKSDKPFEFLFLNFSTTTNGFKDVVTVSTAISGNGDLSFFFSLSLSLRALRVGRQHKTQQGVLPRVYASHCYSCRTRFIVRSRVSNNSFAAGRRVYARREIAPIRRVRLLNIATLFFLFFIFFYVFNLSRVTREPDKSHLFITLARTVTLPRAFDAVCKSTADRAVYRNTICRPIGTPDTYAAGDAANWNIICLLSFSCDRVRSAVLWNAAVRRRPVVTNGARNSSVE